MLCYSIPLLKILEKEYLKSVDELAAHLGQSHLHDVTADAVSP
jgi:hypothetical protein